MTYTAATTATNGSALAASTTSTGIADGATVTFKLGGAPSAQSCTATVAANAASCSIASVAQTAGLVLIAVTYDGDPTHAPAAASADVTVSNVVTTLHYTGPLTATNG